MNNTREPKMPLEMLMKSALGNLADYLTEQVKIEDLNSNKAKASTKLKRTNLAATSHSCLNHKCL